MYNKNGNWEKGSALVMVMMYTMILSILGTAMLSVVINEYKMERAHRDSVKAYYLAEAGIEKAVYEITQWETLDPSALLTKTWEWAESDKELLNPGEKGDFNVDVQEVNPVEIIYVDRENSVIYKSIYEVTLKSQGAIGGNIGSQGAIVKKIEAKLKVEDYKAAGVENKAEIIYWRQL